MGAHKSAFTKSSQLTTTFSPTEKVSCLVTLSSLTDLCDVILEEASLYVNTFELKMQTTEDKTSLQSQNEPFAYLHTKTLTTDMITH